MRLFTESYTHCLTAGVPWRAEHVRTTVRRQEWAYYKLGRTTYFRSKQTDSIPLTPTDEWLAGNAGRYG